MRLPPAVIWIVTIGLGLAISIWSVAQLIMTPVIPRTGGPSAHPASTTVPTSPPQSAIPWKDPSIDPKVLEKAFAPPLPLPPEARPKPSAIIPPEREWRRIQRQDDAVAY